jgi:hypothetical protein
MDALTGAAIAAGVAWISILAAASLRLPPRFIRRLRYAGAGSIAVVGAAAMGLPIPAFAAPLILAAGTAWAAMPAPACAQG